MSSFRYQGRSGRGELVTGRLEADTADTVAGRLATLGITPLQIEADSGGALSVQETLRRLGFGRPSSADLVLFARQMYAITKSGIPLLRGLKGLAQSTDNTLLRDALYDVLQGLESGRELSASLARHPELFSALFVSMVRVGESTGTLDNAFLRLAEYLGQDQDVQDRVKSALRYPIIVVVMIALAVGVITVFVIPNFAPLFKILGNDIPWPTRVIMGASDLAIHHGLALTMGAALLVIGTNRFIATPAGRYQWDTLKLKIPVLGVLLSQSILSRVTRSLSISLEAGLPMIQCLTLLSHSAGNEFMGARLLRVRDTVEHGDSLSHAASLSGIFPPLILQMIQVGEETGEITRLLEEIAGFYQREVDHRLRNLTAMIEPVLMIAVGGMVLILALGVFLPMWNMIAKVGHVG
jgi:MSHA biogenesis protein MshG